MNRGHPTQEGEQAGVAFLLVTFLWPRKEKSLAQARRAGETPSRAAPSCPARRSHAQVTQSLTLALSRKGRGDGYRGAMRCAYCTLRLSRWGEGTVTADDYAVLIDPTCILRPTPLPLGGGDCYRGRLRFANRPYSTRLDPTRPYLSRGRRKPRRGWNPRTLPQARDAGLASANDATAPGSRYHNAPLTLA